MGAGRPVGALVLVAAVAAMAVHYGAVAEAHDPYPTAGELVENYGAHVGDEFYMWMDVVGTEGDTLVVKNHAEGRLTLRVSPAPPGVRSGDVVQVYGVLEPDNRVAARRVVVSERDGRLAMYLVSAAAVPLVVALFLREWTVDWERGALVPREGGDG